MARRCRAEIGGRVTVERHADGVRLEQEDDDPGFLVAAFVDSATVMALSLEPDEDETIRRLYRLAATVARATGFSAYDLTTKRPIRPGDPPPRWKDTLGGYLEDLTRRLSDPDVDPRDPD